MPVEPTCVWYAAHAAQLALGAVFLAAAWTKLRRPRLFVSAVRGYRLLPNAWVRVAAWSFIAVEAFVAVALLTGWQVSIGLPLAVASLLLFLAAVIIALRRGRPIRCGCFGDADELLSGRTVARLALLSSAGVVVLALDRADLIRLFAVAQPAGDRLELGYRLLVAALAAFGLLVGRWSLHLPELRMALRGLAPSSQAGRRNEV
jgi:Methylamine utilisation protein MauE